MTKKKPINEFLDTQVTPLSLGRKHFCGSGEKIWGPHKIILTIHPIKSFSLYIFLPLFHPLKILPIKWGPDRIKKVILLNFLVGNHTEDSSDLGTQTTPPTVQLKTHFTQPKINPIIHWKCYELSCIRETK